VTTEMENPGQILVFTYGEDASGTATEDDPSAADDEAAAGDDASSADLQPASFTAEQAARGKTAYDANCVACHGADLISAHYGPPLAGPYFDGKWRGKTVGALYAYTHDNMPPSKPGGLPNETYADLVA